MISVRTWNGEQILYLKIWPELASLVNILARFPGFFLCPFYMLAFNKPFYQNVSSSRDFCTVDEIPSDCSTS